MLSRAQNGIAAIIAIKDAVIIQSAMVKRMLFGLSEDDQLKWINHVRVGVTAVAAVAAALTVWVTWMQVRLQAAVSANKEAVAAAYRSASEERIADARSLAATASERTAGLERDAAEARLEQERIRQTNLELQRTLEEERMERIRLQERFLPRRLSADQQRTILSALAGRAGGLHALVETTEGADEVVSFARQIATALAAAGVTTRLNTNTRILVSGGPTEGINIVIPFGKNGGLIADALRQAGIQGRITNRQEIPPDERSHNEHLINNDVIITVMPKPTVF